MRQLCHKNVRFFFRRKQEMNKSLENYTGLMPYNFCIFDLQLNLKPTIDTFVPSLFALPHCRPPQLELSHSLALYSPASV